MFAWIKIHNKTRREECRNYVKDLMEKKTLPDPILRLSGIYFEYSSGKHPNKNTRFNQYD